MAGLRSKISIPGCKRGFATAATGSASAARAADAASVELGVYENGGPLEKVPIVGSPYTKDPNQVLGCACMG